MSVCKEWTSIEEIKNSRLAAITACSVALMCPGITLLHLILRGSDQFIATETREKRGLLESALGFKSSKVRRTQALQGDYCGASTDNL